MHDGAQQKPAQNLLELRRAGVLLHPTSLPGPFDNGVLGTDARRFVDFLKSSGFSVWQVLPLGPTDRTLSPYGVRSVFAGNPRLINLAQPASTAWGPTEEDLERSRDWPERRRMLVQTHDRFRRLASEAEQREFHAFYRSQRQWLHPFGLFEALKDNFGGKPWWNWPESLQQKEPDAIRQARSYHRDRIRQVAFEQFLFERQWQDLKRYANDRGVYVFGDLPIYVDLDSVEVWWRPELFRLDETLRPLSVAGVPPDYFSRDGQLWGNPIYDWERIESDGFRWWVDRVAHQLDRFDLLRIDHFRALESYWAIPARSKTARTGEWHRGPGDALLKTLEREIALHSLVAEDLGLITSEVRALRDRFHLPGMLVLQFAFDGSPDNPFLPENHIENAVVYTGTHDNDTTLGWHTSLDEATRRRVEAMVHDPGDGMPDALIREALRSPARLAILPMQDLLGLDSRHRMNTPGTKTGNWVWRFRWEDLDRELSGRCLERIREADRYHERTA